MEEVEVATAAAAAEGRGHCGQLRGAGRPCAKSKLSGKTCPATIAHAREGVDIPVGFILSLGWLISGDTESASLLFRRTGYNKCSSHWVQQMLSNNSSITCFPHCCSITFVCCSMKTCFQPHGQCTKVNRSVGGGGPLRKTSALSVLGHSALVVLGMWTDAACSRDSLRLRVRGGCRIPIQPWASAVWRDDAIRSSNSVVCFFRVV